MSYLNRKRILRFRKKLVANRLYKKYVHGNDLITKDIEQTFMVRGCKSKKETVKEKFEHLMLHYPTFALIFFYRIKKRKHRIARLFITEDYHCKIFGSTKIGGGLCCYHPYASVLNAKSIGENFQFRNGLTIGNKANDNSQLPVIGNNVTVGANVVIIGEITIGDNVIIGAGSVVVKDVPSNCIIAGNPARIIRSLD